MMLEISRDQLDLNNKGVVVDNEGGVVGLLEGNFDAHHQKM